MKPNCTTKEKADEKKPTLGGEAFQAIYQRYRLPLYSYINRLLPGNSTLADDVFQTVWLKVFTHLDSYQERQRLFPWLCRIAHNATMDIFRENPRTTSLDEEIGDREQRYDILPENQDNQKEITEQLDQNFLKSYVEEELQKLPEEQKTVVVLRRQGVPFQEIAHRQKANLNTILGRMHNAIKKIQIALKERGIIS